MNNEPILSKHCKNERMQQRGVPTEMPALAQCYGEVAPRDNEMNCIYFSKRSVRLMCKEGVSKRLIQEVEKRPHLRFIVAKDSGLFVTVEYAYHKNQRIH